MSTLGSLMTVARDAMGAHAAALDLTGKNITNANTPGYVRRAPLLETRALGVGTGGGVYYRGPLRVVDRFAVARLIQETGLRGAAEAQTRALAGLEAVIAPSEGGIGDRLGAFFGAATELASNANDPTARSAFLARATEVAQAFNNASNGITARRTDLLGRAQDTGGEINERLAKIATLNGKIAQAQALGDGAADLRDERDLLVREVSDRIGAQAIEEPDGQVTLLSSGTSLVQGTESSQVLVAQDALGLLQIDVKTASGATTTITSKVDSGTLGGIRQARDVDLPGLSSSLDTLAFDFVSAVNTVHSAGFGLDGVSGRPLFAPIATVPGAAAAVTLDPAMVGQPDRVAASSTLASIPGGNANALDLAELATTSLAGLGTPAARFGSLSGQLGSLQQGAESALTLREDTVAMAEQLQQQASGVSLEEEMVDLSRYQRAFEASMRVLRVADELLAGLIREV